MHTMKAKPKTFDNLKLGRRDEFVLEEFLNFCMQHDVQRYFTIPDDTQSNKVIDRMNQTLFENDRCLRLMTGLSIGF